MTLREKIELLDQLKERYYNNPDSSELEKLRKDFDALELSEISFIQDEKHSKGNLFICPDPDGEFPVVYEIAEEYMYKAIQVIFDAIVFYYADDFWCVVTGLDREDIVNIYTKLNNIPIIRYFSVKEVESLNLRKLRSDI